MLYHLHFNRNFNRNLETQALLARLWNPHCLSPRWMQPHNRLVGLNAAVLIPPHETPTNTTFPFVKKNIQGIIGVTIQVVHFAVLDPTLYKMMFITILKIQDTLAA